MINDFSTCMGTTETIVIFNGATSTIGKPQIMFTNVYEDEGNGGTKWWLWILGIVVVALVGVGGYFFYKSRSENTYDF